MTIKRNYSHIACSDQDLVSRFRSLAKRLGYTIDGGTRIALRDFINRYKEDDDGTESPDQNN